MSDPSSDSSMPRAVWKFPIPWPPALDTFDIWMPADAQPLSVQVQHGEPQMWALVTPPTSTTSIQTRQRTFLIAGTGHPIPENVSHIGTFQMMGGSLILHLFEVQP